MGFKLYKIMMKYIVYGFYSILAVHQDPTSAIPNPPGQNPKPS